MQIIAPCSPEMLSLLLSLRVVIAAAVLVLVLIYVG